MWNAGNKITLLGYLSARSVSEKCGRLREGGGVGWFFRAWNPPRCLGGYGL